MEPMTNEILSYNWDRRSKRHIYIMGGFGIGLSIMGICLAPGWVKILPYVFVICVFFCFVDQKTIIDIQLQTVTRGGKLFGYIQLWHRQYPLSEFTAITCRRVEHADQNPSVFLGLRRRNGRVLEVSYWSYADGYRIACGEAQTLAEKIGLPVDIKNT